MKPGFGTSQISMPTIKANRSLLCLPNKALYVSTLPSSILEQLNISLAAELRADVRTMGTREIVVDQMHGRADIHIWTRQYT